MQLLHSYNGLSSLLFIISSIKAFCVSELILWKLFSILIIFSSYLCNLSINPHNTYILFDYLSIYLLCSSYINNCNINLILICLLIYEYITYKSIDNVKSLTFILAVSKAVIYTYLYTDINLTSYFYIILLSSILGVIIFLIRRYMYSKKIYTYNILLTFLWHICICNIIYISSITAK